MDTDSFLHSGNQVFRDQPPYTHFNCFFGNDPQTDALFLLLNATDTVNLKTNYNVEFGEKLIDPRTGNKVSQIKYDYTLPSTINLFRSMLSSTLTKAQHTCGIRVLLACQERQPVEKQDLLMWRTIQHKRRKEQEKMQNFITKYTATHQEEIFAPAKRLAALYKCWYTQRVTQLLKEQPINVAYNTHAGLPLVSLCKGNRVQQANISNVMLIKRTGFIPLWEKHTKLECRLMCSKLGQYFEHFMATHQETLNFDHDLLNCNTEDNVSNPQIMMTLESLLFLLTAGDYIDLPTEMPVEIQNDESANRKRLKFELPLPARNCGWHTNNFVIEKAYIAYISTVEQMHWLRVEGDRINVVPPRAVVELDGKIIDKPNYNPQKIDEFLLRTKNTLGYQRDELKHNVAVFQWQLNKQQGEPASTCSYDMFCRMSLPPTLNEDTSHFVGTHCIKLEYKPQFGCELMTKYELLREWWRLRLLSDCVKVADGRCTHIAIANFEIQLEEHISLTELEKRLEEQYNIQIPQLISNLMEFLGLLLTMPKGKYLLRHNAKFKDKLLLCTPTKEFTHNTTFLHSLLEMKPSDLMFTTQANFLPIATDLCSQMHVNHKVLPVMFSPKLSRESMKPNANTKEQKFINDREYVLRRVQLLQEHRKSSYTASKVQQKREQRARKRKRIRKLKQRKRIQITEEQQFLQEIVIE